MFILSMYQESSSSSHWPSCWRRSSTWWATVTRLPSLRSTLFQTSADTRKSRWPGPCPSAGPHSSSFSSPSSLGFISPDVIASKNPNPSFDDRIQSFRSGAYQQWIYRTVGSLSTANVLVVPVAPIGKLGGRRPPPRFPQSFIGFIDSMFNICTCISSFSIF